MANARPTDTLVALSRFAISPRARDTIREMNKNWRPKLGRAPDDGTARSRHHLRGYDHPKSTSVIYLLHAQIYCVFKLPSCSKKSHSRYPLHDEQTYAQAAALCILHSLENYQIEKFYMPTQGYFKQRLDGIDDQSYMYQT